jgi:predicted MFS family arabinose efflux permease
MRPSSRYRWFVVLVFFIFMLLHQTDLLMINSLLKPIMDTFGIDEVQIGLIQSGSLLVAALLFPLWGFFYDRYARAKLLALASLIWGCTTWLGAIAPTYPTFMAARASTGIDDSSYPGLYSLIADYFGPAMRSKVYGLLQIAQPLGFLLGMVLALTLGMVIGWRNIFLITGGMGILVAAVIFFGVREMPRGKSEPELENLDEIGSYRFDRKIALSLFRKKSLLLVFAQGFAGVFPWNVITTWFLYYLETERNYSPDERMLTMAPVVLVLAAGYFIGGVLGDALFRRTKRGRLIVCLSGVLIGTVLLWVTMSIPTQEKTLFFLVLAATALFIPFSSPNIASTVYDITPPEVRSTALAIESFIENIGAATAPALAGLVASRYSTHASILAICTVAWLLCIVFLAGAVFFIPRDIDTLRRQMRERAEQQLNRAA